LTVRAATVPRVAVAVVAQLSRRHLEDAVAAAGGGANLGVAYTRRRAREAAAIAARFTLASVELTLRHATVATGRAHRGLGAREVAALPGLGLDAADERDR
jgi:putative hemolysin